MLVVSAGGSDGKTAQFSLSIDSEIISDDPIVDFVAKMRLEGNALAFTPCFEIFPQRSAN